MFCWYRLDSFPLLVKSVWKCRSRVVTSYVEWTTVSSPQSYFSLTIRFINWFIVHLSFWLWRLWLFSYLTKTDCIWVLDSRNIRGMLPYWYQFILILFILASFLFYKWELMWKRGLYSIYHLDTTLFLITIILLHRVSLENDVCLLNL